MRNVSIWELNEVISHDIPPIVRLFQYKGVKRTLNEFLSPVYIYRDGGFFRRDKNIPNLGMPFDLGVKGQVVLMGYGSLEQSEKGQGAPLMVFGSFEQAVHWLVRNGYEFFGEESANWRRRKVVSVDLSDVNLMYQGIAREYEKNLWNRANAVTEVRNNRVCDAQSGVTIIPACETKAPTPPTPPVSRVLNDQGAPVKQKVKKPTFMENMMKFLRLFKK
ncbi:hypothetical protein [Salmonella phage SKML-39]|uniref:Uncharacterized protein n=1 Tax=Salmonella phage SKML-39 TaxID=1204528 RepID=K4I4Z8_9CAUD|nr:hypothetical protein G178_gp199 [Salmonella phage SKML-39]AFU64542.1 hypothetical protein [Salmonella phage SKML-39]